MSLKYNYNSMIPCMQVCIMEGIGNRSDKTNRSLLRCADGMYYKLQTHAVTHHVNYQEKALLPRTCPSTSSQDAFPFKF